MKTTNLDGKFEGPLNLEKHNKFNSWQIFAYNMEFMSFSKGKISPFFKG
jgi:hypothetical protein